jgi:hypothetical protein
MWSPGRFIDGGAIYEGAAVGFAEEVVAPEPSTVAAPVALEIELGRDACALRQRRPRSWRPQSSRRWQQDDPVADRGSGGDLTRQPFVR